MLKFDLERLLNDINAGYKKRTVQFKGKPCIRYELEHCFFDASHVNNDACFFKYENGTISYKCFHNSCAQYGWKDVRKQLEADGINLSNYWDGTTQAPGKSSPEEIKAFQPKTITSDFDPARIPQRQWIVAGAILKGYVSIIIGPGGVGKSVYTLVLAILVAGRGTRSETDLTGPVKRYARTLVINNEDNGDELERRIAAVMSLYDIQSSELNGQFFYESGYGAKRLICEETTEGEVIRAPFVNKLLGYIQAHDIEMIVVDPFVSTHRSNENDNSKIDDVVQVYKNIAAVTGCAIILVHHTRKTSGDEIPTIESSRGGKALSDGCRAGGIVYQIPQSDKRLFGLSDDEARGVIRIDDGKNNYAMQGAGVYFKLESVKIPNGDWVGVPRRIELEEKVKDRGCRVAEVAQFAAMALFKKTGLEGGVVPWSELRGLYMNLSDTKTSKANNDITLLPKSRDKAQRVGFADEDGTYISCLVWYEKGTSKTSPIIIHAEPQKNKQDEKEDVGNDLFTVE